MRKLISFLVLTVLATGAHAQGVVTFANNVIANNTPYVIDWTGARLTGTQWAAQLYYGASINSLAAHTAAPSDTGVSMSCVHAYARTTWRANDRIKMIGRPRPTSARLRPTASSPIPATIQMRSASPPSERRTLTRRRAVTVGCCG